MNGVRFTKDMDEIVEYPCGLEGAYTIPDSVTTISCRTFWECDKLTDISIPDSVTTIGNEAFLECSALTSVTIPEGVETLPWAAFQSCSSLTEVIVPESVTLLDGNVFAYCESLKKVTVLNPECIFYGNSLLICNDTSMSYTGIFNGVICGYAGSTAQTFAEESGYPFQRILTLGDVDGDEVVNASDAAQILIAAALIGAGGTPALAEEQMDAADVNGDSTVDASDAAVVLIYAAAVGAGQEEVKISDFVH